jgi:hypothetical protein
VTEDTNLFGEPLPRLGAPLFVERWSNRRAFWIGVYTGQGMSIPSICDRLGDGVPPNVVSGMLSHWGFTLPEGKRSYGPVKVMLAARDRTKIAAEAKARETDMSELCRQVLVNVARDQLWKAVLDA